MNRLSDEILNKYIDGELDYKTLTEVKEILKESEPDRENLKVLLRVHNELKKIREYEVNPDFTSNIMQKITSKFKPKKADKYFILSISSFFVFLSLAILGVAVILAFNAAGQSASSEQVLGNFVTILESLSVYIRKIFSGSEISIFGSVISLGIFISAYFFFESQKHIKEIQNKL